MGQQCCSGGNEDARELNSQKLRAHKGEHPNQDSEWHQNHAAITMQRHFKGLITRRAIREQYGFVAKTHNMHNPTYT